MAKKSLLLIAVLALVATACGDEDTPTAPTPTTVQPSATPVPTTAAVTTPARTTVRVSPLDLGDIVTDGNGNTVYLFTLDNAGPSVCNDQCAENWPPLVDAVTPGAGLDASLLGTATRQDGSEQATYNGWPLYHFSNDTASGDTNGQGVGDAWWTISPAGDASKASSGDLYDY